VTTQERFGFEVSAISDQLVIDMQNIDPLVAIAGCLEAATILACENGKQILLADKLIAVADQLRQQVQQ